ncbi:xylulokinase [Actinomadura parmotrematis]|uniref:Xylulose kinase n=1 Tax=Actinomadura parmotrematis TaxID=2864039 RepID=A0ABS7G205_9ACTN|nr:xylulokinase [Actinomadura parmotrematis]MBW8486738.1 xylulokinase [Actinomadura parmotrematis]
MTLVAGIDSSTQSCKVVIVDAATGRVVRQGAAPHPPGTEIDPEHWWTALRRAAERAGGLADVAAVSVAAQQHGMVCLDAAGRTVRPALLWNDTRSAGAAADLVADLGGGDPAEGARRWAEAVGTVPVASLTVAKLRWLADHEPDAAARVAAVALPHDWLTWRLAGASGPDALVTDRSDASGTGYYQAGTGAYRPDLLALALRRESLPALPRVLAPDEAAGTGTAEAGAPGAVLGPGCGDNAATALGLGLRTGQVFMSLGTSGVVAAVSEEPAADPTGQVAGFADATGAHLPLACTLNAARVLDSAARLLDVGLGELSELALRADPGAGGLTYVPYLEGERTPNLPDATGTLHGMTLTSLTRENLARAAVEGLLCLMADALRAVRDQGADVREITLTGGAARAAAVRETAPAILGVPVRVPEPAEYAALGAARQAAWTLSRHDAPPVWNTAATRTYKAPPDHRTLTRYRTAARSAP